MDRSPWLCTAKTKTNKVVYRMYALDDFARIFAAIPDTTSGVTFEAKRVNTKTQGQQLMRHRIVVGYVSRELSKLLGTYLPANVAYNTKLETADCTEVDSKRREKPKKFRPEFHIEEQPGQLKPSRQVSPDDVSVEMEVDDDDLFGEIHEGDPISKPKEPVQQFDKDGMPIQV